jgi:hypothetical protein
VNTFKPFFGLIVHFGFLIFIIIMNQKASGYQTVSANDAIKFVEPQAEELNYKQACRISFKKNGNNERRSAKDQRRIKNIKRKAYIAKKEAERIAKNVPHGEESINMRNELLHAASETPLLSEWERNEEGIKELLDSISDITATSGESDMEYWVSHLENIVILGWQVSKAQNFMDVFVAVIAYIKMNTKRSVLKQITDLINELTYVIKPEDLDPQAWEAADVLQTWELFKTNTIFTKISFLISAAMSLSVCSIKEIEWSPFGLKLIAIEAAKQQLKAVDVIDAIISTFTWIAETGYRVIQEGSLMPLLYSDQRMKEYNEECDWVLANAEQALAGNLGEINDYEHKVDNVLRLTSEMKAAKDSGPTALWLQKRYSELVNIKHKIIAKHRNTAIRFAPFGVGITGPSGVGKSTLSKLVMKTALHAMDFETDPKRIITKDMFDKYDSTYTSDILGMFMDDVGNGKSEFAQVSPTDVIIKFFNNMAAQAVKAELNAKGVVFIAFKVGVLTSNFADYNVRHYSEKPEASLRRFIHTRVHIKPQYRKPGSISLNPEHPDLCNADLTQDVWELDIEECHIFETGHGADAYKFRILETEVDGEKIKCEKLDLITYLKVIIALAKRHKRVQESVMARSNEFDEMEMCSECKLPKPMCVCKVPHGLEDFGEIVANAAVNSMRNYVSNVFSPFRLINEVVGYKPIKNLTTKKLEKEVGKALDKNLTPFLVSLTPQWIFQTGVYQKLLSHWYSSAASYDLYRQLRFGISVGTGLALLGLYKKDKVMTSTAIGSTWIGSMVLWAQCRARITKCKEEYLERRDALPEFMKGARDGVVGKGVFAISTLIVGLKLFRMWNKARLSKSGHSLENPDESPGWFGFMMKKMYLDTKASPKMMNVNIEDQRRAFERNNLFWAEFTRADGSSIKCNIFFPRKCVAFIPRHVWYPNSDMSGVPTESMKVKVFRHHKPGGQFTFKVDSGNCVHSSNHDLTVIYVPNCPDLKNRIEWLPITYPKGTGTCHMYVRSYDEMLEDEILVEFGRVGHKYREFWGGNYQSHLARNGACMGVVVAESKTPVIVGFHIGGNSMTKAGVLQTVTQNDAEYLIDALELKPGVLLSADATDIPKKQYDIDILESDKVHPKSVFSTLEAHAFIDVLGSTRVRNQQKSVVEQSIISPIVAEVTGIENQWGAPKLLPNWKGYNATLEHIVNPADMFSHVELERARQDWLKDLIPLMRRHASKEEFRPLNEREMVMGVPGKRFLDALPMSTGMGFPVFGKKSLHFEEIRDGEVLVDRVPDQSIRTEMDRLMSCWKQGKRAYPIATATLKDEPTPLHKEKVRVFQAGAVAFGLYIRKYFLPIARFLSMYPLVSESAVGVNAFSRDWEHLMDHANKFAGDNQVIAWDYSKYDVRMNSQITRAVFLSFIELAQIGGYPNEDIYIMHQMVSDIVHPLLDYNGTLIMAYNMNTSGNNVTVNVNSTAGSFYVRLGFFNVYPKEKDFRKCVAAMTYGDDFKGSVHPNYRDFNFVTYRDYLADHGMKITLPDKGDNVVKFMKDEDADFLKRQSQYIPEIGCKIGKLDEMSIFKSLHSNLKSTTQTKKQVASSCIETAMHEWFAHGREVYDMRRAQMQEVCRQAKLIVPAVDITFDDRVEFWLSKYRQA